MNDDYSELQTENDSLKEEIKDLNDIINLLQEEINGYKLYIKKFNL